MNNQITSAAAFFRSAHQNRVVARVVGGFCHDDWDSQVSALYAQVEERGIDKSLVTVTEDKFTLSQEGCSPRVINRPKFMRERQGVMTVRSADYIFLADGSNEPSHGDKKGATIENGSLVISMFNDQKIIYTIL